VSSTKNIRKSENGKKFSVRVRDKHIGIYAYKRDAVAARDAARIAFSMSPAEVNTHGALNAAIANQLFHYNELTGDLTRKMSVNNVKAGTTITRKNHSGYISVAANNKDYLAHRVIFLMKKGRFPLFIDHIDGNPANNAWSNLREVDKKRNAQNSALNTNSKTGIPGVLLRKGKGNLKDRWTTFIMGDNMRRNIYSGKDFFEACCRRKSAELKYGYHENHGRPKQKD